MLEYSTIVSLTRPVLLVQACLDLSASELLNLSVCQVRHFLKPDIFDTSQAGRYPRDDMRRVYFHQLYLSTPVSQSPKATSLTKHNP